MIEFANAHSQKIDWANEHGTFRAKDVTRILPIASPSSQMLERWRRVGDVLKDVVGYAFRNNERLRPDGSRWSLSNIAQPSKLALSLSAHDAIAEVPERWRSAAFQTELAEARLVPMLVSGSVTIASLNRHLAMANLALRTSGASNGQTVAGACATGTHGAAIRFGAFHDAIRAIHLMVGPKRAVLIQPSSRPLKEAAARDLTHWLGFETELLSDDSLFAAAQVHLGSLGLVLNVILDVEPLYFLTVTRTARRDDSWKDVLADGDPESVPGHHAAPFHLEVVLNPYPPHPSDGPVAWVIGMSKHRFGGESDVEVKPDVVASPNPDLVGIAAKFGDLADLGIGNAGLRRRITGQLVEEYGSGKVIRKGLPGVVFGPTAVPRGCGASLELVVDGADALRATEIVLATLRREFRSGKQFLGGIGVRFVAGSKALLAPNARATSCFVELAGIRNRETTGLYRACGQALRQAGIGWGLHWGQHLLPLGWAFQRWWGSERVEGWKRARARLLPTATARNVFASPLLGAARLDG